MATMEINVLCKSTIMKIKEYQYILCIFDKVAVITQTDKLIDSFAIIKFTEHAKSNKSSSLYIYKKTLSF